MTGFRPGRVVAATGVAARAGNDVIRPGDGNDTVVCGPGNDTVIFGAGKDRVDGARGDYRIRSDGSFVRVDGPQGLKRLKNIETLQFRGDSQTVDLRTLAVTETGSTGDDVIGGLAAGDVLSGDLGNDTLSGLGGNDTLSGGAGNDLLVGGTGIDSLVGGDGNDIAVYAGNQADYEIVETGGGHVVRALSGSEGTDRLHGIEAVRFADGDLRLIARTVPTNRADTLSGSIHADTLSGLGGGDVIDGGGDVLAGDPGYSLDFAGGLRAHTDAVPQILVGGANSTGMAVTFWPTPDSVAGDQSLIGRRGVFHLRLVRGTLQYRLNRPRAFAWQSTDLTLTAGEEAHVALSFDKAAGVIRLFKNGVEVDTDAAASADVVAQAGHGRHRVFIGHGNGSLGIRGSIRDITLWNGYRDRDAVARTMAGAVAPTDPGLVAHWKVGEGSGLTLADSSGNGLSATLRGRVAWRTETGDDTLLGGAGNDTLDGGAGADRLNGGDGNDRYLFGRGDAADMVQDSGGTDRIDFGAGIGHDQLWFERTGTDLTISVIGTTDSPTVAGWFGTANPPPIETITVASGHDVTARQINNLVSAMAPFAAPGRDAGDLSGHAPSLRNAVDTMWGA